MKMVTTLTLKRRLELLEGIQPVIEPKLRELTDEQLLAVQAGVRIDVQDGERRAIATVLKTIGNGKRLDELTDNQLTAVVLGGVL